MLRCRSAGSLLATLLPKKVLVAFLVVVATVATERLGPVFGALIRTPVTSGAVIIFLALAKHLPFYPRAL
jgi:hypothetical protein